MKRTTELPLLLSPAGGEEAFLAALAAGADAIYLGGAAYNARAYAKNFDEETLTRCIALAHARGVKVHVTLNTCLTDRELTGAVQWAERLWAIGADALISADVGLITLLRRRLPGMAIHASTQLSLHSTAGATEVSDLGFETVVVAREVDRDNLTSICRGAPATVESFVHGALCVSHSGQCLFSSLVGGRSGNRGECAQPCRLPYGQGYPLSLKDLSLADHIPSLLDTGSACLKIEGRMKSPAYVWGVTKIYRRLLDERRAATAEEKATLARIFSRSGFTDGYYTRKLQHGMTGVRREEDKVDSRREVFVVPPLPPVALSGSCRIVAGESATLTLVHPHGRTVTVTGAAPDEARNAPLTEDGVKERLCRMGGTPYTLAPENIELTLGEGLNLSPAALNALRRAGLDALADMGRAPVSGGEIAPTSAGFTGCDTTALFMQGRVWEALSDADRHAFDLAFVPLWEYAKLATPPRGVWFPPVIFDSEEAEVLRLLAEAKRRGATHALCGNPAQIQYARDCGLTVIGDFRLNITNTHAAAYWAGHGVSDAVLSPELTAPQMRDIGGRAIVYGRVPLMLTERCYASPTGGCDSCHEACANGAELRDRRGVSFPILRVPAHRNIILNSLPTYMGDKQQEIPRGIRAHFIFSCEGADECREVIEAWRRGAPLARAVRRFTKPTAPVKEIQKNEKHAKKQGSAPLTSGERPSSRIKRGKRHK